MPPRKSAGKAAADLSAGPPIETFEQALNEAGERPDQFAIRAQKKNYSERLSNKIAVLVAHHLRATGELKGEILPYPSGIGREKPVPSGAFNKPKKTDVNFSTLSGLELLVSIKTMGFRDVIKGNRIGRYTKNMVRNDHELRAEAMEFHERYPFAVLVALFFIPRDACDDGESDKSSFAHAVMTFRARTGRRRADEPAQLFELFYIGLYDWKGTDRGRVEFFDVLDRPRRHGPPSKMVGLDEVITRIIALYGERNRLYIEFEEDLEQRGETPKLSPPPDESETDSSEQEEEDGDGDGG